MDAVLAATIKAYDEFTQQFKKFQDELKKTDQAQKQVSEGSKNMSKSFSDYLRTIGELGAVYAFQRALRDVMQTGREFELSIKQAQAVTNDMTSALRDAAMTMQSGVQGPREIAQAFYELGSAGLNAMESIKATPDILDFATAGMIKMEDAAYAVSSTVKSFRLEWSQTTEVVDAFTQAMNSTAMKAEDFKWTMSSVGAVGKMAGQDFREVVAAVAAMRDAGVQAQDAGTSVKAALVQLINPTKESRDIMKSLGISVFDSSGKMKQWHEIIAEFERALVPYNEQSRNFILTTIAGTDGVRALATGLNMGSTRLAEYVGQMGDADGATKKMAGTMADTFDGALRKVNANLDRLKILLFEDLTGSATDALGWINALIVGFNNLDAGTRTLIEALVGSVGLVLAITAVISVMRILGVTAAIASGPIGWTIAAITALTAVAAIATTAVSAEKVAIEEHNNAIVQAGERYETLTKKLSTLKEGTDEYKRTQEQINNLLPEIERLMPGVIAQWDAEGRAIGVVNEKLKEKIKLSREAMLSTARSDLDTAISKEVDLEKRLKQLTSTPENPADMDVWLEVAKAGGSPEVTKERDKILIELEKTRAQIAKSKAVLGIDHTDWGEYFTDPTKLLERMGGGQGTASTPGTRTFTPPEPGKKPKTAEELAKEEFEASRKWIEYKKSLNQLSAEEEIAAWARVATRYAEDTEQRMDADVEVYRAKQRLVEEDQKRYDDAYQQAMDLMRHEVNMARMSVDQRIEYLQKLRDAHQWTQQQMWGIEEELYRLRKQQLSDYLGKLDDEYKSKLDAIDERTNASIKAIQDQIDALEGEGKMSDREETTRKHNDKLKELQDERRRHELRTGTEHQKAIADIDKQIAEEQREFEKQQGDWSRDDKKESLQKQVDDARKAGDEERKELEDHYRKARKIAESGIMDVISALAATGPEWLNTGKELIDQLIAGLEFGDFSGVESKIGKIKGQAPQPSTTPSMPGSSGGGQKQPSQMTWQELLVYFKDHVSEAMAEIVRAGGAYSAKLAAGDIEGARAAHHWANQIREAIGQPVTWDSATNSYAKGGPILYDQIAKLHAGEYVLPANLVDAIRLGMAPPVTPGGAKGDSSAIDRAADRIVAAIESRMGVNIENLLRIENFNNEDGTDTDILLGDVRRAVDVLAGTK